MLKVTDLRGHTPTISELRRVLPRGGTDVNAVLSTVTPIVEDVREHGAAKALEYGQQFDGITPESVRVPRSLIDDALNTISEEVREALEEAISRIRKVHADQKPAPHTTELGHGATVTEKFIPITRVGLYVPGGEAVYPSSVLMNVIPAQEAGAETMVVCTPPQEAHGGWPHPTILAACKLLGVEEIWLSAVRRP